MALTFAEIGSIYNAMTDELVGGVSPANKALVLNQINTIQTGVQNLINNGDFNGATLVHAQNIADQMNFLKQQVAGFGTPQSAPQPKFINDVVRDVQDIVAADNNLAGMAAPTKGFQQVSNLLVPPTPYPDSGTQTTTLLKFIADSNDLAARAQAAVGQDPNSATVKQLVTDIQNFSAAADAYSTQQGGVFSARFNNEFNLNGVQGTASRELVNGLNAKDTTLVNGAATVLMQNAADVKGNMLTQGMNPATPPALPTVADLHTGGQYFDDAVTKLIGGVYGPSTSASGVAIPGNQTSIVTDLKNAATGIQDSLGGLTGASLAHAKQAMALITQEATDVAGINAALQPSAPINTKIALETAGVLNIINNDAALTKLAGGSFIQLPPVTPGPMAGGPGIDNGHAAVPAVPATPATPAVPHPGMMATPAVPATPATPAIPAQTDVAALDMQHIQHTVADFAHMWHHG